MNVFDFDGTIYRGDSTIDFYLYCVRRNPGILVHMPGQFLAMCRYKMGLCTKTEMKEKFYVFLKRIKNAEFEAEQFWKIYNRKVKPWYLKKKEMTDVVISASPEFLLKPICRELKIGELIASRVNPENGRYIGENCYGEEKVRRFRQRFKDVDIDEFYSDSQSDLPMARMAKKAYILKSGRFILWYSANERY